MLAVVAVIQPVRSAIEPMARRGWLAFRDRLRADYSVAREYASLKTALAAEHGDDPDQRDAYRGGKAAFIRGVTEAALRDATPTREPR